MQIRHAYRDPYGSGIGIVTIEPIRVTDQFGQEWLVLEYQDYGSVKMPKGRKIKKDGDPSQILQEIPTLGIPAEIREAMAQIPDRYVPTS